MHGDDLKIFVIGVNDWHSVDLQKLSPGDTDNLRWPNFKLRETADYRCKYPLQAKITEITISYSAKG